MLNRRYPNLNFFLSGLLCCFVGLCSFQLSVAAQGEIVVSASTEMELLAEISNAGTTPTIIDVTNDITFSSLSFLGQAVNIPGGADITIRASGKNIVLAKDSGDYAIFNIESGGKLTLSSQESNVLIVDGMQIESTASTITTAGTLVTNNVDFRGNYRKTGNGGAISVLGASAFCALNGGVFEDNKGGYSGGAVASESATLKVDGSAFTGNTVYDPTGNGGAIYAKTSTIEFKNSTFSGNTAMVGGAAEFTTDGTGTIENCKFLNNQASGIMGKGGALDFDDCVGIKVLSGDFENNSASTWGGAIYTDGSRSDFFMNTVLFESNSASIHGGAIWHCPLGTAHYYTYSGMMFWNNTAAGAGADMYLSKAAAGKENGGEYVAEKSYAGEDQDWCYDTETNRYDASSPDLIMDSKYYQGSNELIAMKSNLSEAEYLSAKDAAKIIFQNNSAPEGGAIANNGFVEVGYKSGLTIEKEVTGTGAPTEDSFDFTVTFSDGNPYGGIESGSTVSLKAGEKKLISDIPKGISVTVTEQAKKNYTAAEPTRQAVIGEYGTELLFINSYTAPSPTPIATSTPSPTGSAGACTAGQIRNAAGYCVAKNSESNRPDTSDFTGRYWSRVQ